MPEEIYISNAIPHYYIPNIVICNFHEPAYARSSGESAAVSLFQELSRLNFKANLILNNAPLPNDPEMQLQFIRKNKYDIIVTGQVIAYLDGGISTSSRVEENLTLYSIAGNRLQLIGSATALETAPSVKTTDYILIQGRGQAALSADILLKRNSQKFARLIDSMLSDNYPER